MLNEKRAFGSCKERNPSKKNQFRDWDTPARRKEVALSTYVRGEENSSKGIYQSAICSAGN